MRVVLDARMAGSTGIGRYIHRLTHHLAAAADLEVLVATNPGDPMAWLPPSDRVRPVCFPRRYKPFSWREHWGLAGDLMRWKPDVVHAPNWNAPSRLPVPLVVTFHDLIYYHYPASCPSRLAHWYARWALRRMARRATHIISVSRATADDAVATFDTDPSRITVVHHGLPLDPAEAAGAEVGALPPHVQPPFVMYVGTWAPHKNLPLLVAAVAKARRQGSALQLVIVGVPGRHGAAVEAAIAQHGIGDAVLRIGRVSDAALRGLYHEAAALALPSRIEGFGFTPLEAFAYDCPVVAADIPVIREVANDGVLGVPVDDADALAAALVRLETDETLRADLQRRGRARLGAFSWTRAAEQTAEVYRRVCGNGRTTQAA